MVSTRDNILDWFWEQSCRMEPTRIFFYSKTDWENNSTQKIYMAEHLASCPYLLRIRNEEATAPWCAASHCDHTCSRTSKCSLKAYHRRSRQQIQSYILTHHWRGKRQRQQSPLAYPAFSRQFLLHFDLCCLVRRRHLRLSVCLCSLVRSIIVRRPAFRKKECGNSREENERVL